MTPTIKTAGYVTDAPTMVHVTLAAILAAVVLTLLLSMRIVSPVVLSTHVDKAVITWHERRLGGSASVMDPSSNRHTEDDDLDAHAHDLTSVGAGHDDPSREDPTAHSFDESTLALLLLLDAAPRR